MEAHNTLNELGDNVLWIWPREVHDDICSNSHVLLYNAPLGSPGVKTLNYARTQSYTRNHFGLGFTIKIRTWG